MPETKGAMKTVDEERKSGPIKAKVHATRTKQIVLAFFDNESLIYTNYIPGARRSTPATSWKPEPVPSRFKKEEAGADSGRAVFSLG